MEYRQAELRLEQLYTQIRMQVVNAHVRAHQRPRAGAGRRWPRSDYAQQSLDAEQKKLQLGASTTANVLQQQRNLAIAEDNLIAANASLCQGSRRPLPDPAPRPCSTTGSILPDAASGGGDRRACRSRG